MCVYLSNDNFRKPSRKKFIFAHPVYLQEIRVKFVYEGHRVKVKVTGAKKVENLYNHNVKLDTKFACSMGFSHIANRMV